MFLMGLLAMMAWGLGCKNLRADPNYSYFANRGELSGSLISCFRRHKKTQKVQKCTRWTEGWKPYGQLPKKAAKSPIDYNCCPR